jgi:hypothetical protein
MALPFPIDSDSMGVFLLRRTTEEPKFDAADVEFASTVVRSGVSGDSTRIRDRERAGRQRPARGARAYRSPDTTRQSSRSDDSARDGDGAGARYNAPLSMLLIDLDHFKLVNDTYGHIAGDSVLAAVASLLQRAVRACDLVARYGGEEFVAVLPETGKQGAMAFAERIRERIAAHGFSIGEPD